MALNFNTGPWNDDFDEQKHFYRVLYKPGYALQARELTTSQSILQQQVTNFGKSIYQHGAVVVPGGLATDPNTGYVQLQPTYGFIGLTPIPINLTLFQGNIIQGDQTNLLAQVLYTLPADTNGDPPTLYVKYLTTGTGGAKQFSTSENLTIKDTTTILAQTATSNPCGLAITAQIDTGVYFIYGLFVRVEAQYLVLSKYSNVISTRIGLEINESVVTAEEDPSLADNAQGTTNYAAPGADRYKIDLILTQKSIGAADDSNFVEIVRLINSVTQTTNSTQDTYSIIENEFQTRMYDTNGNFVVRNFSIDVREHLDTSFVTSGTAVGAAAAGTSTPATLSLASTASVTTGAYVGFKLYISDGSGIGQSFFITAYNGTTKVASLDADYAPNKLADTTSVYIISDLSKVNRGIYPPPPYDIGDASKLAIGMESGRAYVDGAKIDTLNTIYVPMDKARDSAQTVGSVIPCNLGNYVIVKNLYNIPLPSTTASKDFLQIAFSNIKSAGSSTSFNSSVNQLGTARVHGIEFFQGSAPTDPDAVFKMYLFDINMNVGADINSVRSFAMISTSDNNEGGPINAYGDVCTEFAIANPNGLGLIVDNILTGPSGVGTELIVSYDPIANILLTEPNAGNTTQILTLGQVTAPSSTTATISARAQIFDTGDNVLIYPLPQTMIKTVRGSDSTSHTSYLTRQVFTSTINGSYQYIFNSGPTTPFYPYSPTDYLAVIEYSTLGSEIGQFVDLGAYITSANFTGTPANTTLTFAINAGLGSRSGTIIKLMATLARAAAGEKLKALTTATITYPNPTAVMNLNKADVYKIVQILDSGNPGVAPDPTLVDGNGNLIQSDIKNNYYYDTGQRDYYYDTGSVALIAGATGPAGQILITFQYFAHSGSGDYFSVDSYTNQLDYTAIPNYLSSSGQIIPLRDSLDFRPRKGDTINNFSSTGSSYSAPVKPNSISEADYQYYLNRIDKIFLDQYGNFNVIKGIASLTPTPPPDPVDGMMLYTMSLNPYTLSTTDLTINSTNNRRYTMHDIGLVDDRLKNVEYYTSLNELEQSTASLQITDTATGLDRFKNGFVIDTFIGHNVGDVFNSDYTCSVDPLEGSLRPPFVQDSNTAIYDPSVSTGYVVKDGKLILIYDHEIFIQQIYVTDVINVNPFAIFGWYGQPTLNPGTDTWLDTIQRPVITVTDNSALDGIKFLNQWSEVTWGQWQTAWVGVPQSSSSSTSSSSGGLTDGTTATDAAGHTYVWNNTPTGFTQGGQTGYFTYNGTSYVTAYNGEVWADDASGVQVQIGGGGLTTNTTTTTTTTQQVGQTRTGTQTMTTAVLASQTVDNSIIDTSVVPYIRSRRIQCIGRHFKPLTRLYPFFDGDAISQYCRPYADPQLTPTLTQTSWTTGDITWGGDFSPEANSSVGNGISQVGDTGQTATVPYGGLGEALYSDPTGTCTFFFEIPCDSTTKYKVGTRVMRLTDSPLNDTTADTYGEANYIAAGILQQSQETITSVYVPQTITQQVTDSQVLNNSQSTSTNTSTTAAGGQTITLWVDPLAQSFLVNQTGGVFISKVDLFFAQADPTTPITLQIRNMVNGYPGQTIVPFSEKTLYPNNVYMSAAPSAGYIPYISNEIPDLPAVDPVTGSTILTSDDGTVPTTFEFDCPVFLNDGTEYALVLTSNSNQYLVYIATLGGRVIGSTNIVSQTPYLGNLFKSQNASTWVADPTSNMTFNIYRAKFDPTNVGTLYFTNSSVQPDILNSIPFQTYAGSNVVRVYHPAHAMPKGQFSNSLVTISNVAPGTYNGFTEAQLNGTFSINNVDLDSYTITVADNPVNLPAHGALSSSRVGPDGVVATKNRQYDSLCPVVSQMVPPGSAVDWNVKTTTGKSPHNNPKAIQEPYIKDALFSPIQVNLTNNFLAPCMIASDINETTSIVGASAFDRKSLVMQAVLSTTADNLTPVIDASRIGFVTVNNRIDDPNFANETIDGMDAIVSMTSTSMDSLSFASQTIIQVVAVTGTPSIYTVGEFVTGAASGAQGQVVSWDSVNLTVNNTLNGTFQIGEAIAGTHATGTVQGFEIVNTITNPSNNPAVLDFTRFTPGFCMTINGLATSLVPAPYGFTNPVVVVSINGNTMTVDTGTNLPFTTAANQSNITLTQYGRFVSEEGPNRCSASARYITRQFTLANEANSLHVYFTINRPPGSFVDCYYRVLAANSSGSLNGVPWTLMVLNADVDSGESTNYNEFKEYVYQADQIGAFTAFSVKLVMRGGNSSLVPRMQNFRGIALAE